MSDVHCRACGAAVPERAQWCSLCFADLREPAVAPQAAAAQAAGLPIAEPVPAAAPAVIAPEAMTPALPEPVAMSSRLAAAGAATAVLAGTALDPHAPLPGAAPQSAGAPARLVEADAAPDTPASADVPGVPTTSAVTWPCPRCGEDVSLSVDTCPQCGAGFLAGASGTVSTKLPLVGDVASMTSGQRWLVAMGMTAAMVVVIVFVLFVLGSVV